MSKHRHTPSRASVPAAPATSRTASPAYERPALKPLVLALMTAMPLLVQAQAKVPALPVVAPNQLPVAAATWRSSGTGAAYSPNATTGKVVIDQSSQRAIYNWQSYNIGKDASVTYQFNQTGSSALNRINSGNPSQILGQLSSTVPGANGTRVTGGTVLLINPNGILFGNSAVVNTGGLIASTLNVDDADYLSGFANSINSLQPTYVHEGGVELYTDDKSFVRVEQGAQISTASGGQVFLFAKNVENAGSINTPGGQTVLGAGTEVYLNDPSSETLYASEVNIKVPALRGLLVEVAGEGRVLNAGSIDSARGNTTLVGMAVNQSGRISATTSVSENGSVFLLARGGSVDTYNDGSANHKRATTGGALTLGEGSRIEISADTTLGSDGKVLSRDGNTDFTRSRIELSGQTVVLEKNAQIVAPSAVVNVRAEDTPFYLGRAATDVLKDTLADNSYVANSDKARVVIGEGAGIDVSGTTTTQVSVARNFVTTELLGGADLADAPLQRSGPLYRSKVSFDTREAVSVLSSDSVAAYKRGILRDANELMATGGTVSLVSTGAVLTHQRASLDVSGGQVQYTADTVTPTYLVGADGQRYTVNSASKDVVYTGIEGQTITTTRWGQSTDASPNRTRTEAGYTEGKNAGTLNVLGRQVLLDGQLSGQTFSGARQQSGADALAARASLNIGRSSLGGDNKFGASTFGSAAGLGDFRITADAARTLDDGFWADPIAVNEDGSSAASVPSEGRIAAATLNASGFGTVNISSAGKIIVDKGADLNLPQQGSLALRASGEGGIQLGGSIHSVGGTVLAQTANLTADQQAGDIVLGEDAVIDVAGNWVNRWQDGAQVRAAVAGGSVKLLSAHGLDLESNTLIDVSGGATVSTSGSVSGTKAGSIELESNRAVASSVDTVAGMHLGAELRGYALSQGGSLRLKAAGIDIVAAGAAEVLSEGEAPATFILSSDFFQQGGFASYDIDGASYLHIAEGTTLAPQAGNWLVGTSARNIATGSAPAQWLSAGVLPDAQRKATNLSLSASGLILDAVAPSGSLVLARTASIQADALAKVSLSANAELDVQGDIRAAGGAVSLALQGRGSNDALGSVLGYAGHFEVGSDAVIDVSGRSLLDLSTNGLRTGKVLDGGSIALSVSSEVKQGRQTRMDVAQGAQLRADGAVDGLDVTVRTNAGTVVRREQVASQGGSISLSTSDGGASIAGQLQARSLSSTVAGGSLSIQQPTLMQSGINQVVGEYRIDVAASLDPQAPVALGQVRVGADTLNNGGFADISLSALQRLHLEGDVALQAGRNLTLQSQVISASPDAQVRLNAATAVTLASSVNAAEASYAAEAGTARVDVHGGLVRLVGDTAVQGVGSLNLKADQLVQLEGLSSGSALGAGALRSQADVIFEAPQTTLSTKSQYTVDAAGHSVTFTGGDASSTAALSAGSALTVNAATIVQDGVLRAPLGSITLNATASVTLTGRSLSAVSGAGLEVPYGQTTGGSDWRYLGTEQNSLPAKAISLLAPGQSVTVSEGAVLDLSGGGAVKAYEFVPGPGGSTDALAGAASGAFAVLPLSRLNTGYAASDAHIAALADSSGNTGALPLGQTITFGEGGPLPAGTYAVLPARYALLEGAFLVSPSGSSARVDLGYHALRADGSALVGAQLGATGTTLASAATGYIVRSSAQAKQLSEIRITDGDAYVANAAKDAAVAVPRLAQDVGALNIAANQLVLESTNRFNKGNSGIADQAARGGGVAIAADRIEVRDSAEVAAQADTLVLDVATLNATGADTLTLGALRSDTESGGRSLQVSAREVVLSNKTEALQAQDVVLAATEQVQLSAGAQVQARAGAEPAEALQVQGDGALLRVSSDASASTVRTDAQRAAGTLDIGAGASLSGASLTAEATAGTRIAGDAQLQAQAYTLGAARVAVGDATAIAAADVGSDTLVLSAGLAQRLSNAQALTLRSYDSIDFYGNATLGGSTQQSLTLDAGTLRVMSPGGQVQVQAGGLSLSNTSKAAATAAGSGDGRLSLSATGAAGGSGVLTLGPGDVATSGAATTELNAQRSVLLSGATSLSTGGDLQVTALSVTAQQSAEARLSAAGLLQINAAENPGNRSEVQGGTGATLALSANQVQQAGTVRLASGQLSITALGEGLTQASDRSIELAEGSITDLAGKTYTFDGQKLSTGGGVFKASAAQGAVVLADGSVLDVSAGGADARAGQVSLSATQGSLAVDGTLLATSKAGAGLGGTLTLDSRDALSLAQLAQTLDNSGAQAATGLENFGAALSVRNRSGDQVLDANTQLKAQHLALSSDSGGLDVRGSLDASGSQGGRIELAAGQDVQVASGAVLRAAATGSNAAGGHVEIASTAGRIALEAGAQVDAHGTGTAANGKLLLRAQRSSTGGVNDVAVDPIAANLSGLRSVEVEAVKTYQATTVNTALINTIQRDNTSFFGSDNGAAMQARLAGDNAALAQALSLRAGVEVQSTGNLTLSQGWNLSRFDAEGQLANPGGQPVNLTLRAAGNLLVQAGLSSGFKSVSGTTTDVVPTALVAGQGGTIRLVAGADTSAANLMHTVASADSGDVVIGKNRSDVLVRSSTGDVQIAAGRDVQLLNAQANVYTTGVAADTSQLIGYVAPVNKNTTLGQSAMLQGGGSVLVAAQGDVVGAGSPQYGVDWWWRGANGNVASWWSRYDKFQQGFGALGGGDVAISAGHDVKNVGAAAPLVGYLAPDAQGPDVLHTVAQGDVSLQAGHDVSGSLVMAGGQQATVMAGHDVDGLQVLHGNTSVRVDAQQDVAVGRVSDALLIKAGRQWGGQASEYNWLISGTSNQATLRIVSESGDLSYSGRAPQNHGEAQMVPAQAMLVAAGGKLEVATDRALIQTPLSQSTLLLGSAGDLKVGAGGVQVGAATSTLATPAQIFEGKLAVDPFAAGAAGVQIGEVQPVRVLSQTGNIQVESNVAVSTPLRMLAAGNITQTSGSINLQHTQADDLSLIQAGGNIELLHGPVNTGTTWTAHGPGDLVVAAGGDIDLGQSGGFGAMGNRQNSSLPGQSAALTVLAGVHPEAGDYDLSRPALEQLLTSSDHAADLLAFVQARTATVPADAQAAWQAFAALPMEQRILHINRVLSAELRSAGRAASALSGTARDAAYQRGYDALDAVFVAGLGDGDLRMGASQLKTLQGSDINVYVPRGGMNVGQLTADTSLSKDLGIVTTAGGSITGVVRDDIAVNRSRVFTVAQGDILLWASQGNIDAGRGAKTVTGAPPPVYRLEEGRVVVDTSGSYAGSGIAVLNADSDLDLYAPKGEINAGDAGIKSAGNAFFGAVRFVGADNLQVGGTATGGPPPVQTGGATAGLASLGQSATSAGNRADTNDDEDERRKRRARRNLMLEFLGFGQ